MDNWKKRLLKVVCIMAAFAVSFSYVNAEEPETSEVDDNYFIPREAYAAYKFFEAAGYGSGATVLEERQILKSELVSSGELSINGDGTASFNVSLASITDEDNNTIDITTSTNIQETIPRHYIDGTPTSYINVPKLTFYTTNTNNYGYVQNTIVCNKATGTYGWTANSTGTTGTLNLPNYSCTYSPYFKTEINSFNLDTNNLTFEVNEHKITGTDTTTGSAVFDLTINTSGTVTGSITFDLNGTFDFETSGNITNDIEHEWIYNYPIMKRISTPQAVTTRTIGVDNSLGGYPIYISFISNTMIGADSFRIENYTGNYTSQTIAFSYVNGFYKRTLLYVFDRYNSALTIKPFNTEWYLPLYFGNGFDLSDEYANFIGLNNKTQKLIETGNINSQNAVATAATTTNELDTTSDQLHQIDTGYLDSADQALNSLDTSSVDTLLSTSDFLATANWLSTQITNFLGVNSVFSTVVYFSLVLGIILVVLGRMR